MAFSILNPASGQNLLSRQRPTNALALQDDDVTRELSCNIQLHVFINVAGNYDKEGEMTMVDNVKIKKMKKTTI